MAGGRKQGTAKTGGRKKGTPNKATDTVQALIEKARGGSPLEKMANLARDLGDEREKLYRPMKVEGGLEMVRDRGFELRLMADLDIQLAQYCAPKRKAIEVTGPDGGPVQIGKLTVEIVQSNAA